MNGTEIKNSHAMPEMLFVNSKKNTKFSTRKQIRFYVYPQCNAHVRVFAFGGYWDY